MIRNSLIVIAAIIMVAALATMRQCSAQDYLPNSSGLTVDGGNPYYQSGTSSDGKHWSIQSGFGSSRYHDSTGRSCMSVSGAGSTITSCNR